MQIKNSVKLSSNALCRCIKYLSCDFWVQCRLHSITITVVKCIIIKLWIQNTYINMYLKHVWCLSSNWRIGVPSPVYIEDRRLAYDRQHGSVQFTGPTLSRLPSTPALQPFLSLISFTSLLSFSLSEYIYFIFCVHIFPFFISFVFFLSSFNSFQYTGFLHPIFQ